MPTNHKATISGTAIGGVLEDSLIAASGQLTVSDSDPGLSSTLGS